MDTLVCTLTKYNYHKHSTQIDNTPIIHSRVARPPQQKHLHSHTSAAFEKKSGSGAEPRIFDSGTKHGKDKDLGTNCATIDICPDILIAAIFAAAAAVFVLLYMAITKAGRRRKRNATTFPILEQVQDVVYNGSVLAVFLFHFFIIDCCHFLL